MTVVDAIAHATKQLAAAGVAAPDQDAERLLRHVLAWDRARVLAEDRTVLSPAQTSAYGTLVGERARRRPLQHLTGQQAFWKHDFLVTKDVLIPRPETELLVEVALDRLSRVAHPVLADVGTGSGCIALSLAAERPEAEVHATDLSRAALGVAEENARRLGLVGRVRFHLGDLLTPLDEHVPAFDVVVSNPPYVDRATRGDLSPEVRDYEPPLALFPPDEPYSVYRRLAPQAARRLRPGGCLLLEVGNGMADTVVSVVQEAGFVVEQVPRDLQGIPRAVVATRLST